MYTKDLRGLTEAYTEVYAPQEVDEAVKGASRHDTQMRKASAAERRGGEKRLPPSKGKGYADQQKQQISYMDKLTKKNKNIIVGMTHEELDIFDVVLEFLQAEGYAETLEEAEWMMANVIDEEAIEIILGEGYKESPVKQPGESMKTRQIKASATPAAKRTPTQNKMLKNMGEEYMDEAEHARNNPDKYEEGEKKKYAPVPGERTPMPPPGSQRRKDFEKWYAANVR